MNNTQNQTASSSSQAKSTILNTKFDPTGTDQGAVSYLQIVCLLIFAVQLVAFLVILKKYILKFVGFFILRKDYQNLHILDMSEQNSIENGTNQFVNKSIPTDSTSLNGKSKIRQWCFRFQRKLIQNIHIYHPLTSLALFKCNKNTAIKLPCHVIVWVLFACLLLTLSLTIIIAQLGQSKCLDKRFYATTSYACKQTTPVLLTTAQTLIASVFISAICVAISFVGIFKFSKNYLSFLYKFSEFNNKNRISQQIDSSPMYNKQTELKQNLPTQQNMLDDGSDYSKRSLKGGALPPINEFSAYKTKGLFQINEAENDEECNSQRSENGTSQKKKDRDSMITKSNGKQIDSKANRATLDDPFNRSNKIDQMSDFNNNNNSQKLHVIGQQHSLGSAQKNKLLDSTTIDGQKSYKFQSPDQNNQISKQEKFDLENDSPNKDLKKMEDTQRISMVPSKLPQDEHLIASSHNKRKCTYQILKTLIMLSFVILFVLGILLDAYAFFNMTHNGLLQVLKVFGLALAIDAFILRVIGILLLSLISTITDIKNRVNTIFYNYDSNQLDALGQIYKGYQQNTNQYIPMTSQDQGYNGPNSDCDSDEQLLGKKNRKPNSQQFDPSTFGGLRFIKLIGPSGNRNRSPQEILLVEPTYFNKRNGQSNQNDENCNDNNHWQNKQNNKRDVLQHTSLNFHNNQNGVNSKVNYGPNEEKLNSNMSQNKDNIAQTDNTFEIGRSLQNGNKNNVSQLPSIFGNKKHQEIEEMEMNQTKHKQNNSSSAMYPGQSISYNNQFGVDFQGSPLQENDYNNMSDALQQNRNKQNQDQMYPTGLFTYQNGPHLNKNGNLEQYGDLYTSKKKKMFGKIMLPNGFALFNLPVFNGIWGKGHQNDKKDGADWNAASQKKSLGQLVNGGDAQYYNFPSIVDDAENKLNMILTPDNNLFRSVKKNSKGEIQIIDSTQYHNLPFMKFDQLKKKEFQGPIITNSAKKRLGEEVVIDSSLSFKGQNSNSKQNQSQDDHSMQGLSDKKKNQNRDVIEIDSTLLFNLPLFSGNQKLTSEEANAKKLILKLVGKNKKTSGEIIEVNATKFYNLPMFTGKASLTPEMQSLSMQLNTAIKNMPQRDIIEIDSTYLYSLPMFQNSHNLTKEAQQFKTQFLSLMGNKQPAPGEIIQIDSTKFYNLPIFQGSAALSQELQSLQTQIKQSVKRKPAPGEIVQIDSTMLANLSMFAENANLSPEAQEIKRQILAAIGTKKLANGEIVQIDSSQLFNLTLFKEGKAQLSPELQELTKQLLSVIKRKTTTGQIVGVDATYIIDLSNNLHMTTKQSLRDQEENKDTSEQNSIQSIKKRKTNRALIQGVSSQLIYDANSEQPLRITPLEKQITQMDSQTELNELIHDGRDRNVIQEQKFELPKNNNSFNLPPINNVRSQMFETPDGLTKGINRNTFENSTQNIELNDSRHLEELIEKQEVQKKFQNSSLIKYGAEDKENSNIYNIPLKLNGSMLINNDSTQQQDQLLLERDENGQYSPKYNSNTKKSEKRFKRKGSVNDSESNTSVIQKKKKTKNQQSKGALMFLGDSLNENDRNLQNIGGNNIDGSLFASITQPDNLQGNQNEPINIYQARINQSSLDESLINKKERMNLENFIKPNIPKMKKYKNKKTIESKDSQLDFINGQQMIPFDDKQEYDQSVINVNDSNRSKIYEDSDSSTFRMINFSKTKQIQEETKKSQDPPNFYLNSSGKIEDNKSKKVFEIVEEDDINNSDGAFEKKKQSQNLRRGQVEVLDSDQDDLDILGDMNQGKAENEINDLRFSKRKQIKMGKKMVNRQESIRSSSSKENKSQGSYTNENPQLSMTEQIKLKREKKEKILERLNEQKRKLTHFLKLAQQIKSVSDENKINELIEIITLTKKPLPMSRINELKSLEMMSSPYNQSLTAMIKDEIQFYKKKKSDAESKNSRIGKSQQRNDQNNQEKLSKLGGIYGNVNASSKKPKIEQKGFRKNSPEVSLGDAPDTVKSKKTPIVLDQDAVKGQKRQIREKTQIKNTTSLNNQNEIKNMSSLAFNSSDDDFIAKPQAYNFNNNKGKRNMMMVVQDQDNIQDLE